MIKVCQDETPGSNSKKSRLIYIIILILSLLILTFAFTYGYDLYKGFKRAHDQALYTGCQSNCKNIGTALALYKKDNGGHYPQAVSKLTPRYLIAMPTCPASNRDTYSGSYRVTQVFDGFTVFCSGNHHKSLDVDQNYPQYDNKNGLIPR